MMNDRVSLWESLQQHMVFSPLESLVTLAVLACIMATAMIFFKRHLQIIGLCTLIVALVCLVRKPVEPVLWATLTGGFVMAAYSRLTRRLWKETAPQKSSEETK
jgi:chromate transport protein ChrA